MDAPIVFAGMENDREKRLNVGGNTVHWQFKRNIHSLLTRIKTNKDISYSPLIYKSFFAL
jgi:hypothetical protein